MSSYREVEMVLTGSRTGKTELLNGHSFVNGTARVLLNPVNADTFLTLIGRMYHAYPRGSAVLAQAQERDRANGILRDLQANPSSADGAPNSVQGAGDHSAGSLPGEGALCGERYASGEAGRQGLVSGGPGHADAGLGEGVERDTQRESDAVMRGIQSAVSKLDFSVSEQWTENGLPSVDYVAEAVKNQSVTREMIEAACPGYTRAIAEDSTKF